MMPNTVMSESSSSRKISSISPDWIQVLKSAFKYYTIDSIDHVSLMLAEAVKEIVFPQLD